MKRILIYGIFLVLIVMAIALPVYADSPRWQLGDDMVVSPIYMKGLDCDDATVYQYIYFVSLGYETDIAYGDLLKMGESYFESNHYWVVVHDWRDGKFYPYDMGYYMPDGQHLEYHKVSYGKLLQAMRMDYPGY